MENKKSFTKKALLMIGLMFVGAQCTKKVVDNYKQTYCRQYDCNGVCICCPNRSIMTEEHTCLKVSDQCADWCKYTGACTACYKGFVLTKGECISQYAVKECYQSKKPSYSTKQKKATYSGKQTKTYDKTKKSYETYKKPEGTKKTGHLRQEIWSEEEKKKAKAVYQVEEECSSEGEECSSEGEECSSEGEECSSEGEIDSGPLQYCQWADRRISKGEKGVKGTKGYTGSKYLGSGKGQTKDYTKRP